MGSLLHRVPPGTLDMLQISLHNLKLFLVMDTIYFHTIKFVQPELQQPQSSYVYSQVHTYDLKVHFG